MPPVRAWRFALTLLSFEAVTRRRRPALHPRLLDLEEQITRLPDQLAELPAFRDNLAGEQPMLEGVLVTARST
jgi:hypothetical protein